MSNVEHLIEKIKYFINVVNKNPSQENIIKLENALKEGSEYIEKTELSCLLDTLSLS
jgi:hypothetical protein